MPRPWIALACFFSFLVSSCQTTTPRALPTPVEQFPSHQVGFVLYDAQTRKVVAQQNADTLFIPASVTKVPTTLAALSVLGADFRFHTTLSYRGRLSNGVLHGDLHLKGGGDPFLTLADLMDLALRLKAKGIQKIEGKFCYDDSEFIRRDKISELQDEDAIYNTSLSALSSEFNRYIRRWSTDPLTGKQVETVVPNFPWLQPPGAEPKPLHGSREVPVKDGSRFTAELLASVAQMNGLALGPPYRGTTPANTTVLVRHASPPLMELAERELEYSNNFMAELLLLATAKKLTGRILSSEEAASVVNHWFVQHVPGISWEGYVSDNGSGLSSRGRMSPNQAVGILTWGDSLTFKERNFLSLLPISGWKGTLRDQLWRPSTSLRVWAKTGTLEYAKALAGYAFTKTNRKLIFALFISDIDKRNQIDASETSPAGSRARLVENEVIESWIERARVLETSLITDWIARY